MSWSRNHAVRRPRSSAEVEGMQNRSQLVAKRLRREWIEARPDRHAASTR